MTIKDICASFNINGKYISCEEVGSGNINSTYKVKYVRDGEKKEYIIQRINKKVFTKPEKVMENIVSVTESVRAQVRDKGLDTHVFVLRAFTAKESGLPYMIDDCGEYWRCYRFIKNSVTYDAVDDLKIIERTGQAFGQFQNYLNDFDASSLNETIPNFHNTIIRYKDFHKAIEKDVCNRVKNVKEELEELLSFENKACLLQEYLDRDEIPTRVTHNDTKCNNVSFDKDTGEALAVLDLDTVMPGAIAHDFGDAIRYIANTVIEDYPEVEEVALDLDKYEAFTKGFIVKVKDVLTEKEKETMNLGVFSMTVELAVRFLTDYLNGDVYFKTKYPGHNVYRARNQIALAQDVLRKKDCIGAIIKKYL